MTHWANMIGSQRHAVAQWHSLHARSHCDQVSHFMLNMLKRLKAYRIISNPINFILLDLEKTGNVKIR